jgi:hypothetical protein
MNDGEAVNWKEYYLETPEDPNTGFPNLVTFLADVQKAFRAADQVQDTVNRLETLKQGKKTAEELNMEFLQIVGQAGIDKKTPLDYLHLIRYYREKLWNQGLVAKFDVPRMIDGWMEKAIQFDTNWRMGNLFFNPDMKVNSSKKADTNKMHIGGEQTKGKTLMRWMLMH